MLCSTQGAPCVALFHASATVPMPCVGKISPARFMRSRKPEKYFTLIAMSKVYTHIHE